jgi:acetoacetyl-CoA synthetase
MSSEGSILWEPSEEFKRQSRITHYLQWLSSSMRISFDSYESLWRWSVESVPDFWASLWKYFEIRCSRDYKHVLEERGVVPQAKWFSGAELNYCEHIFRQARSGAPAIISQSELRPRSVMNWEELAQQTGAVAAALRQLGVRKGDRVAAYVQNIPESVIAFLACSSIGAIWSTCSTDFGMLGVLDRFRQIEPKVLFAVDGYQYGGKSNNRIDLIAKIQQSLPTLEKTVLIPYLSEDPHIDGLKDTILWSELLLGTQSLTFEQVPFDHPLWVLYSSGTTGLPKAIVQGQGGVLLEHLKACVLHADLGPDDRFFWFTTTGWMMWNMLVSGLLTGASIVLYDGSPSYPDIDVLWSLAENAEITCFGTSPAYISSCMKAGYKPASEHNLAKVKSIGSTGSPLSPEAFEWVHDNVKQDIWLASISGGTDVCSAVVGGCPLLPVRSGEIQCRYLGAKVEAYDLAGEPSIGAMGEMVITEPMPSMPLFFWNDKDGRRLHESYFSVYPGVWRHGDWILITHYGSCVIYGRSDATVNRHGVRIGTSEIYRAVESLDELADSLVVDLEVLGHSPSMLLFVVLRNGVVLDHALKDLIRGKIRNEVSPRHAPDEIYSAPAIPRTLNGKKLEIPIKRILLGNPIEQSINAEAIGNPAEVSWFVEFANWYKGKVQ